MQRIGVIGLGDMGSGLAKNLIAAGFDTVGFDLSPGRMAAFAAMRATLEVRPMGEGQLADQFRPMADALRADGHDGVISYEGVYHPGDGDFEAGFRQCIGTFKEIFA